MPARRYGALGMELVDGSRSAPAALERQHGHAVAPPARAAPRAAARARPPASRSRRRRRRARLRAQPRTIARSRSGALTVSSTSIAIGSAARPADEVGTVQRDRPVAREPTSALASGRPRRAPQRPQLALAADRACPPPPSATATRATAS